LCWAAVASGRFLPFPSAHRGPIRSLEVVRIGYRLGSAIERSHGLKPNYQYEKRQREMEKKKKKAEKEQKKAATPETPEVETPPATDTAAPPADN